MCISHVNAGAPRGQQEALDSLELELQAIVSRLTWVLGTELGTLKEQQHF